ncbi:hypothetical protein AAE02nite_28310 [Adhaeribacter aerolatus]|uniref:Uncharacterized protein n=1 Tax=Adhaeribacter aerolatus TaxID=670289 RepID=A0A512B055_9BACT|nr:hypothetical protein [Adhaeribacter aerolatus]GEO05167.1 hypothetical protein AAE02nite_28310 [Adhaeribacter aerolatus]
MKKEKEAPAFPIRIENFDQYEITDCSAILRYLESVEANKVKDQDYQKIADRAERRINYMMFE